MFGKNLRYKKTDGWKELSKKGFLWKLNDKYSSPLQRYSSILQGTNPIIKEGGGLHGNSSYYRTNDNEYYIRLQVVSACDAYVEINAKKVRITDATKFSEELGFSALSGKSSADTMIGIVSSFEEIDNFLDEVWDKWVNTEKIEDEPKLGFKWLRVNGGFKRVRDDKFCSSSFVKKDGGGWYIYENGDDFITFLENDIG
jgi:hypothetical protein